MVGAAPAAASRRARPRGALCAVSAGKGDALFSLPPLQRGSFVTLPSCPRRSKACNRVALVSSLRMRTYRSPGMHRKDSCFKSVQFTQFRSITSLESRLTEKWRGGSPDHRLRLRTHSQPAPSHCPHGFSSRLPVARQAGQASQSALFAALPTTPVQRLPAVTCEHWPLIISGEYDNAPQRVQTATGCGFWLEPCSGLVSGVWLGMRACVKPTPNLFILETARP